jgi:hypothetical protein
MDEMARRDRFAAAGFRAVVRAGVPADRVAR